MGKIKKFFSIASIVIIPIIFIVLFVVAFIAGMKATTASADGDDFDTYVGDSFDEKVWWALKDSDLGLSDIAIAGAMGNFYHESSFISNNLENIFETKLGYTDETYTAAVDDGSYSMEQFISDHDMDGCGAGYGLCQWTWNTRKKGLYEFAKSKNVSIADENMQIEYVLGELNPSGGAEGYASYELSPGQGYSVDDWKNATTIEQSARAFCGVFEKGSWSDTRSSKAQEYYDKYHNASRPQRKGGSGDESDSDTPGIKGYYTALCSGRTYTEYYQNDGGAWDWEAGCWVSSQATIMSGFGSKYTPNQLPGWHGAAQQYTWKEYGNCNYERVSNVQASDIKRYLLQGHAIHIRVEGRTLVTDNGSHPFSGHSLTVLDYKKEDGKDKVYIHDPYKGDPTYGWTTLSTMVSGLTWYEHVWQ